jgi:hypothetical protein
MGTRSSKIRTDLNIYEVVTAQHFIFWLVLSDSIWIWLNSKSLLTLLAIQDTVSFTWAIFPGFSVDRYVVYDGGNKQDIYVRHV